MRHLLTAVAATAALTTAASAQTELITDGSFEATGPGFQLLQEWNDFNNVSNDMGAELAAQDGMNSLKMFGQFGGPGSETNAGVFQQVTLQPNTEYTLSGYAQSPSFDLAPAFFDDNDDDTPNFGYLGLLILDIRDSGGALIEKQEIPLYDISSTPDVWNFNTTTFTSPPNAAQGQVTVILIQFGSPGGAVWFDNVSLIEGDVGVDCSAADQNGDQTVDFADVLDFLNLFDECRD